MLLKNPARERERKTIRGRKSKKQRTADLRDDDQMLAFYEKIFEKLKSTKF